MKRTSFLIGAVLVAGVAYGMHQWLLDGIDGTLLSVILPDDTIYAEQYSDARFRQISIGATEADVRRVLGPPLDTGTHDGALIYRYARSVNDSNYHVRVIVLRSGLVSETLHSFYVD